MQGFGYRSCRFWKRALGKGTASQKVVGCSSGADRTRSFPSGENGRSRQLAEGRSLLRRGPDGQR